MRIAHLADLHLGFRMYERTNPRGANQREADVAAALRWAVDDILEQAPDAVVIAGDLFHSVRPTNAAIMLLFGQLQRIRADLPRTEILAVAGNHDTPRAVETGTILPLYRALGVTVHYGPTLLETDVAGVHFVLCPSGAPIDLGKASRTDDAVLVCHGEAHDLGGGARSYSSLTPSRDLIPECVLARPWAYCALGHEHVFKGSGRAFYAGATEYTSTDPWGEMAEQDRRGVPGKGYALVDLGSPPEFRHYAGARRHLDLPSIDATGMGPMTLSAAIGELIAGAEIDDAVVRLLVREVDRDVRRQVDHALIRDLKARALNFSLRFLRPQQTGDIAVDFVAAGKAAEKKRQSLVEMLDEFLEGRQLPDDVDRGELRRLGRTYLENAQPGAREEEVPAEGQPAPKGSPS